jgi:hypothetical protein
MNLPKLDNGRIDLHDNGPNPGHGKTRWGLLIDLQNSKHRWNINFEVLTDDAFLALSQSAKLTEEQRFRVHTIMETYVELGLHAHPLFMVAHGKRNELSGTGTYKLIPDYDVLALLDLREGSEDPSVALVWGDETYLLKGWYSPNSTNSTIVARRDLNNEVPLPQAPTGLAD